MTLDHDAKRRGELLAPVGNLEMLVAAIEGGADAVFLAGPKYGARAKEASFTIEGLKEALRLAHRYDVKVYVTLNTLIKAHEFEGCCRYIDLLVALGIDAIIVQDLGVVSYARKKHPTLPLHASTQMAISDEAGLEAVKSLGIERVVIARETPLSALKAMVQKGMPIEVFVHGALCYAYSGQCLLSSVQGGRSGNRGLCAQPCRLTYAIDDQEKTHYAMSMKDLATIDAIDKLVALGVSAFKVEGRLRSPDYVYHTVSAYRAALDGIRGEALSPYKASMYAAFNREYTGGHLLDDQERLNLTMSTNRGESIGTVLESRQYKLKLKLEEALYIGDGLKIVTDKHQQSRGIEVFNIYTPSGQVAMGSPGQIVEIDILGLVPEGSKVYRTRSAALSSLRLASVGQRRIPIRGHFEAKGSEPMTLWVSDGQREFKVRGEVAAPAVKAPATEAGVRDSLDKLGDTVYRWEKLEISLQEGLFMPKSTLNALRRQAIDGLDDLRGARYTQADEMTLAKLEQLTFSKQGDPAKVSKAQLAPETAWQALEALEPWHFEVETLEQLGAVFKAVEKSGYPLTSVRAFMAPRLYEALEGLVASDIKRQCSCRLPAFTAPRGGLIHNQAQVLGIAHFSHRYAYEARGYALGIQSPVMNPEALACLREMGVDDVVASVELTPIETQLLDALGCRVFVYGQVPVMYTRTCPRQALGQACQDCSRAFKIQHEGGLELQVKCHERLLTYYTVQPLFKGGAWSYRLAAFVDESEEAAYERTLLLLTAKDLTEVDFETLKAFERPIF